MDFGVFQQTYEYLQGKLSEGGALTPEEQKVYDGLLSMANQGLDLTKTADFQSLYTAFNTLADSETKQKFEELYGTGLIQDPTTGAIQFTRPGTLVAAMMRRGLSVKDGPVQALLSEGLKNFLDVTAKNSFAAMTNSYQAMTPIRQQNLQAAISAGEIASRAIGRMASVAGHAVSAGTAAGAAEAAAGDAGGTDLPVPPTPEQPGMFDKILPGLLTALATGGMGLLGGYLFGGKKAGTQAEVSEAYKANERPPGGSDAEFPQLQNDPNYFATPDGDTLPSVGTTGALTPGGVPGTDYSPRDLYGGGYAGGYNPYQIDQAAYTGYQTPVTPAAFGPTDPYSINPIAYNTGLDPNQYYGMSDQGWSQPQQQPYDYASYMAPDAAYPAFNYSSNAPSTGAYDYSQPSYDYGNYTQAPVDYSSYADSQPTDTYSQPDSSYDYSPPPDYSYDIPSSYDSYSEYY